jgi:DNA-binding CsgD family transcriptional regulator
MELAERCGLGSLEAQAWAVVGLLELGIGHHDAAVEPLEQSAALCTDLGLLELGHWQWAPELVEARVLQGQPSAAEAPAELLEWHAQRCQRPIILAMSARCRALLGDDRDYEACFEEALRWHDLAGRPFELARTRLCFGRRLRHHRKTSDARRQLEAALSAFSTLGASPWASLTQRELEAAGTPARRTPSPRGAALTPQELLVAVTVAGGATNKEAAAELFLSVKTIEFYLSRIYMKLNVRSRTELANSVNRLGLGASPPAGGS